MENKSFQGFHLFADKTTKEFKKAAVNYFFYNSKMKSLCHGKNIDEIDRYTNGNISMRPFKAMFKSEKEKLDRESKNNSSNGNYEDYDAINSIENYDSVFEPLPLMVQKINSGVNLIEQQEVEFEVTITDNFAKNKIDKDLEYLKSVEQRKSIQQEIYDQLQLGEKEVNGTIFNDIPLREVPLGLNLYNSTDQKIFIDCIYTLAPSAALEKLCEGYDKLKNLAVIRELETLDHFKYGVSAHQVVENTTTGLSNVHYIHPSNVYTWDSYYSDYRDIPAIYIKHSFTPMQLMDVFKDEIADIEALKYIINNKTDGYNSKNGIKTSSTENELKTQKIKVIEFQVKTVDFVYLSEEKKCFCNKNSLEYNVVEKGKQNTYKFYWLDSTNYYFGNEILGFATRHKGQEYISGFNININRSSRVSPVELCIPQNKKAIRANIKINHALLKAVPNGKVIDVKYIRNMAQNMLGDGDPKDLKAIEMDLINKAIEDNIHLIDTEGFDGQQDASRKAVEEVKGGLTNEINGYYNIIVNAENFINKITGINNDISGTNNDSNMLNFARKSNIIQGVNSLKHIQKSRLRQTEKMFNFIIYYLRLAIEKGGAEKKMLEALIGIDDTNLIDKLDTIVEHETNVSITLGVRDDERQDNYNTQVMLEQKGLITAYDKMVIKNISNPKKRALALAILEDKAMQKIADRQEAANQQQQQFEQQKGQNLLAAQNAKGETQKNNIYTEGEVKSKLTELQAMFNMSALEKEAFNKRIINRDKANANLEKIDKTMQHKEEIKDKEITQSII